MSTLYELSRFANSVYGNGKAPQGWELIRTSDPSSDGYFAQAWKNTTTGEIVIANRGTVTTNKGNLWADAQLASEIPTAAANEAIHFAQQIASLYPGATITETGHSLGGYEAQVAVAYLTDNASQFQSVTASGVTFNAPGIANIYYNSNPQSYNVLNLYSQGDFIHLAGGAHLGTSSASLPLGPSLAQEASDFEAAFKVGSLFGAQYGVLFGSALLDYDVHVAHSMQSLVDYLSSSSAGGLTAQQFVDSGLTTTPSSLLTMNSALSFTLKDASGNSIEFSVGGNTAKEVITALTGAGFLNGESSSTLSSELGSGIGFSLDALWQTVRSLLNAPDFSATISSIEAAIGSSPGEPSGAPGQVLAPNGVPDNQFVYNVPSSGITASETIDAQSGQGSVWVGAGSLLQLQGGPSVSSSPDTWVDSNGDKYVFAGAPGVATGTLTISGGLLGTNPADSISIQNFDIGQAQSAAGYLGISLSPSLKLTASANAGTSSSTPSIIAGSSQSYTVWLNAPSEIAQTVTLTMTGVPASDFAVDTGTGSDSLNSNGTFTVSIAAGETSASFSLTNTADVGANGMLQLSATLPDQTNPGQTISAGTLTQSYVEPTDDPFAHAAAGSLYDDGPAIGISGLSYELYSNTSTPGGAAGAVGSGNNYISVTGVANDSVAGGSGDDTVYADFGYLLADGGTDVITGNGGSDVLWAGGPEDGLVPGHQAGPTAVRIYGDTEVDLQTAIENANSGAATGQKGDFIVSDVANSTLVGGDGNNLFDDDSNGTVIAGPGNDTIYAGVRAIDIDTTGTTGGPEAGGPWGNIQWLVGADTPAGYEGAPYGFVASTTNNTIFGGSGNDLIWLSNGNNDVQLGTGASTVIGGTGSDTIIGGGGANSIVGGGGNDYLEAGDGGSLLVGSAGDNTLIGGAGNDTLDAGAQGDNWATQETGNNYVQAGSGNTIIFGSGGNDTLLGGSGDDTINAGAGNEYVAGGSGNESINGGSGNDTLEAGGAGNDTIWATTGNATIYGGDGSDLLNGGSASTLIYAGDGGTADAPTTVWAGSGETTIYGGDGVDYLNGGSGDDVIYAGDGGTADAPTRVWVGSGDTTVYGGEGTDVIFGGSGTDVLYAGDGGTDANPSYVIGGSGTSSLYGGVGSSYLQDSLAGSDLLQAGDGDSTLVGMGHDTLVAGSGEDLLSGTGDVTYDFSAVGGAAQLNDLGSGTLEFSSDPNGGGMTVSAGLYTNGNSFLMLDDSNWSVSIDGGLTGAAKPAVAFDGGSSLSLDALVQEADASGNAIDSVLTGTNGNLVFGTANGDVLTGGTGQDTISAWGNNDTLTAGSGGDSLVAAGANDSIQGGSSNDTILALGANDTIDAGSGTESIQVQGNNALVYGGPGNDTLALSGANATVIGGTGNDIFALNATSGSTQIVLSSGHSTLQFAVGVTAADLSVNTVVDASGNLALQITDGASVVTLDDGLGGGLTEFGLAGDSEVNFAFADGTRMNFAQFMAAVHVADSTVPGATGNLILNSDTGAYLSGGTGNDTLLGTGAGDTLVAGSGNQALYGFSPGDELAGGTGNDTLYGGGGDDTLAAGVGDTTIYGGSGSNSYLLTEGGVTTIYADGAPGVQTLELPEGTTAADFTAFTAPDGDLILQSLSGDTTAILNGFYSHPGSGVWLLTDNQGDGQLLQQWAATSQQNVSGNGSGGSGGNAGDGGNGGNAGATDPAAAYQHEIDSLRTQYADTIRATLQAIGSIDASIETPERRGSADQYDFTGVNTQNVTVQGGQLTVGSSESDSTQLIQVFEGTRTETYTVPVYAVVNHPAESIYIPGQNVAVPNFGNAAAFLIPVYDANFHLIGYNFVEPASSGVEQVGERTETVTVPVVSEYLKETKGFTDYNITGDGGNDFITATAPFVGTVETGNGNVSVDLGIDSQWWDNSGAFPLGHYTSPDPLPLGAFIELGNGDDSIRGTGGADTIAAGLGSDSILASLGSTIYVPMLDGSSDYISVINAPYYGSGPYPNSTLVLPEGVTPTDLAYSVDADSGILKITYGSSSVYVAYDPGAPSWYLHGASSDQTDGINAFRFSDGTVLTRTEILAMAAANAAANSSGDAPVVTALTPFVLGGSTTGASSLFAASNPNSSVTEYQVANSPKSGAYFSLNGVSYVPGATVTVTAGQLAQLEYHAGASGSVDTLDVEAFNGTVWSSPSQLFFVAAASGSGAEVLQASGPNQTLSGPSQGPGMLFGGYGGDTLIGGSGQDTFLYTAGSGAETISEGSQLTAGDNDTLQFGPGITAASLTASMPDSTDLALTITGTGDSVDLKGFDLTNPLGSTPIQHFDFSDGTSLSLVQLLNQIQLSSGTVTNSNGSSTDYYFGLSGGDIYESDTYTVADQVTLSYEIYSDGTTDVTDSTFNSDGSSTSREVVTPPNGGAATVSVESDNSRGQVVSYDITYPDGSTVDSTYAYNADGSYSDAVISTPAGAGAPTTTIYYYDSNGNLVSQSSGTSTFRASGLDENVSGPSSGPDTLIGGFGGDTLVGASGADTFEYASGSGAETISETVSMSSSSANVLQFGSGISPSEIALTFAPGGALVATIGSSGDSVTIDGFDPTNPLASMPIQQFQFAGGANLSFAQLLGQVQSTSEQEVSNPDGTHTDYMITPGADPSYDAVVYNNDSQPLWAFTVSADGATERDTFTYAADGSFVQSQVTTDASGNVTTNVMDFDAEGNVTSQSETEPDGSILDYTFDTQGRTLTADATHSDGSKAETTYAYNADGTFAATEVDTPAGGGASTTIVTSYDANSNVTAQDVTNPDGSTLDYTFDAQVRVATVYSTAADGSKAGSTFAYNSDGSYVTTEVDTPAGGGASTTIVTSYDANSNVTAQDVTNPDGSTVDRTYDAQGRIATADSTAADGSKADGTFTYNADGTISTTEVDTPAGGGAATTEQEGWDASGRVTYDNTTYADGSMDNYSMIYSPDGSRAITEVATPADGSGSTTYVTDYSAADQKTSQDVTLADGGTQDTTYSYGADGSSVQTEVDTTAAGQVSTTVSDFNAQGNSTTVDYTHADGSTDDWSYRYDADGSTAGRTEVITPADGSGSSTIVTDFDSQGRVSTLQTTNADGGVDTGSYIYNTDGTVQETDIAASASGALLSTTVYEYSQGRKESADETLADGSTQNTTYSYNADGTSSAIQVATAADQSSVVTSNWNYDSQGNVVGENVYTSDADGSYDDSWRKPDGSSGEYWWNNAVSEYRDSWYDSNGSNWTDTYQYAAGGSAGSSGVSFTETYMDTAGDEGLRSFDASTGVTSLSWYSSAIGTLTGTTTDAGFIGIQTDGELTNTQADPSFFNPAVSPAFQSFLAGH